MKQYCRYCANFVTGNGSWCEAKQKNISDSSAKTINKCKSFVFCEIDAFNYTRKYKERKTKDVDKNQPSLF